MKSNLVKCKLVRAELMKKIEMLAAVLMVNKTDCVGGGVDDGADFVGPPPFFPRRLFFSRWSISALARVLFLVVVSWDVVMLVPVGLFVGVRHASFLKISESGMSPHS